ncbi:hypothetical protein ACIF8T_21735 [Streptomyces sp. NPDC085946]|uniref:hypothetical protein n=1 Tax=Streptomyces sp. NPDC085946 TaxID=3365744 RepID=UPI0037D4105C
MVLALLNEGASPEDAAAQAGVSVQSLVASAAHDGELRAALNGQPPAVQQAARKGDFLAALTRTGGILQEAALLADVDTGTLQKWRTEDPAYAGVEDAVVRWLTSMRPPKHRAQLTDEQLDHAASLLEQGKTIKEAARAVGVSGQGLRNAGARHPRLAAALPPIKEKAKREGRASGLTPKIEAELRRMWADSSMSVTVMAGRLGVSPSTLRRWAKDDLQLPQRDTRVGRHWREAPPARRASK